MVHEAAAPLHCRVTDSTEHFWGKPYADIDVLTGQQFLLYEKFLPDISGIGQQVEPTFAKAPEQPESQSWNILHCPIIGAECLPCADSCNEIGFPTGAVERIRDKIAASKKKGYWIGGTPPPGQARHSN